MIMTHAENVVVTNQNAERYSMAGTSSIGWKCSGQMLEVFRTNGF